MDNLASQGWFLTESGLKSIETLRGSKNLSKFLLDHDLREVGAGNSDLHKGKFESLDFENAILQIQKIRNISAPKANETSKTAPKLLKIQLTDGVNTYSAIELEPTTLDIDTKPGIKVCLKVKRMKMANGQLLFTPKNIEILGGTVETLVSKWELARSLAGMKDSRGAAGGGGPPPFIPFGQQIQQNVSGDQRGFKSLQPSKPKESENDDLEFKAQRKDAIAEASKAATKKTFGGGSKILVDSNVQKIMDKGYTEEQATTALRYSRNNVEKALGIIKRKEEHRQRAGSADYESQNFSRDKRGGNKALDADSQTSKPSGAVSLFDFLENKIPAQPDASKQAYNERFENNMSSSFRKFDKDISNNSQRSSQKPWDQKSSHQTKGSGQYNSRDNRVGGPDKSKAYRNHREEKDSRWEFDSKRDSNSRYQTNNSFSKFDAPSTNPKMASSSASNYNSKDRYKKPEYPNKPGPLQNSYNNNSTSANGKFDSYSKRSRNINGPSAPSKYQPTNDFPKSMNDSMQRMNLKENVKQDRETYSKLNVNSYPPLIPSETPNQNFSAKSAYQIVGFQDKEANEHAKTALKTKNIPGSQKEYQRQSEPPHKMSVNTQQPLKNQPPPPFPNAQQPTAAPMAKSLPQPFVQHPNHATMHPIHPSAAVIPAPTVFHPPINYSAPLVLQGAPPPGMVPQPINTQFKIGDLCFAKYWEDAQYYNAKITNISENTYVVLFTEYGNAEEVRKSDCLPLISAPIPSAYRIPAQKIQQHNYQSPSMSSGFNKNVQHKNHRRN